MKKKIIVWSGLAVFLTSLLAGVGATKVISTLSPEERIKADIEYDKMVIGNPGFLGEPMRYVETRQKEAREDLAQRESDLASLQSPSKLSQADLEKLRLAWVERAIRRDQANIDRPGQGTIQQTMPLTTLRDKAQASLATHEARLQVIKEALSEQGNVASLVNKTEKKSS